MLTLILVRHSKSLHESYINKDSERHLAPRGYEEANASAIWCKQKGILPNLMVSSYAIRAYSTALIFANNLGYHVNEIVLKASIYNADVEKLMSIINEFDDRNKSIMMFGHNPGFTDLLNKLCGSAISDLPTSSVAMLKIPVVSWSKINPRSAKLEILHKNER